MLWDRDSCKETLCHTLTFYCGNDKGDGDDKKKINKTKYEQWKWRLPAYCQIVVMVVAVAAKEVVGWLVSWLVGGCWWWWCFFFFCSLLVFIFTGSLLFILQQLLDIFYSNGMSFVRLYDILLTEIGFSNNIFAE